MMQRIPKAARVSLNVAGLVLLVLFVFGLWSMGGSHAYYEQARAYSGAVSDVLITHGICDSSNDCAKRHVAFISGDAVKVGPFDLGGVDIDVYEVTSPEVVGDLVKAFGEIYKRQRGPRVRLDVYETKHLESKTRFAKVLIE